MDRRDRRQARRREVAHLIRTLRLRKGLTQEALALRMTALGEPTSRSQVSMWEMPSDRGQMPDTWKFLAILEATEPEERPETPEERQARVMRGRLIDLRRLRPSHDPGREPERE
jgi:transcriptional regulator with XRE-family HTH domain